MTFAYNLSGLGESISLVDQIAEGSECSNGSSMSTVYGRSPRKQKSCIII